MFVAVYAIEKSEQRKIESIDDREDRIFQDLNACGEVCRSEIDHKISDQHDNKNNIDKDYQTCGKVRFGLRFAAVFSVSVQEKE